MSETPRPDPTHPIDSAARPADRGRVGREPAGESGDAGAGHGVARLQRQVGRPHLGGRGLGLVAVTAGALVAALVMTAPGFTRSSPPVVVVTQAIPRAPRHAEPVICPQPACPDLSCPAPATADCPAPAVSESRTIETTGAPLSALASAPDGPLAGVAVARGRGAGTDTVIAVWSPRGVAVSRDGGRAFALVRTSPDADSDADSDAGDDDDGPAAPIRGALVDRAGQVYVIRDAGDRDQVARVANATSGDTASLEARAWHALPGAGGKLAAHDGRLVWLGTRGATGDQGGEDAIAVSADHGASWKLAPAPIGNFASDFTIDDDGRIHIMNGWEAGCGGGYQARAVTEIDRLVRLGVDALGSEADAALEEQLWRDLAWPLDIPVGWMLGARGWAYGVDAECTDGEHAALCAVGPDGKRTAALPLATDPATSDGVMASNGRIGMAVLGAHLIRTRGAAARVVATDAPALTALAVDRSGRLLAVHRGYLVNWAESAGWRVLYPSPAALALAGAPDASE